MKNNKQDIESGTKSSPLSNIPGSYPKLDDYFGEAGEFYEEAYINDIENWWGNIRMEIIKIQQVNQPDTMDWSAACEAYDNYVKHILEVFKR